MGRAELIRVLAEEKNAIINAHKYASVKRFILSNRSNFVDPDDPDEMHKLSEVLKDPETSIKDICSSMGWLGVRICEATTMQMFDIMYEPSRSSSSKFEDFLSAIKDGRGYGTVVYIIGKKAVLVTNKLIVSNDDMDYIITKKVGCGLPSINIVPWYIVKQKNMRVTDL